MKSITSATTLKTFFRSAFFTSSLFLTAVTGAVAQKTTDSSTAPVAAVSYLGYNNDQLSFLMKYETENGEKFNVTITDADGNVLFNENFTDKKFSKIFKSPLETGSLTFIISNPKNKDEKKFRVSTERRMVEEFSITKAN
jgi:hypothetical protein